MSVDRYLKEEDRVLGEIQSSLASFSTTLPEQSRVIYLSHFVTRGPRLYNLFKKHGVSTKEQLEHIDPVAYREKVMDPNIQEGIDLGSSLRKHSPYVIVPGVFFRKGWTQQHYMSLWEQVIIQYSDTICFHDEFHSSPGSVQELLIGIRTGKDLRHIDFSPLDLFAELPKIRRAIDEVADLGVDPAPLYDAYRRIAISR